MSFTLYPIDEKFCENILKHTGATGQDLLIEVGQCPPSNSVVYRCEEGGAPSTFQQRKTSLANIMWKQLSMNSSESWNTRRKEGTNEQTKVKASWWGGIPTYKHSKGRVHTKCTLRLECSDLSTSWAENVYTRINRICKTETY